MSQFSEEYRKSELKRLEAYERILLKRSLEGDSTAIDRLLKISEIRIKVLGLGLADESKKLQKYLDIMMKLIDKIFKFSNDPVSIELAMEVIDQLRLEAEIPIEILNPLFETITKRRLELGDTSWAEKLKVKTTNQGFN